MKRHRRRRLRVRARGIVFLAVLILIVTLCVALLARACRTDRQMGVHSATAAPVSLLTPEPPVVTAEPTVSESPEPAQATAVPSLTADWYLARCARLRRDLKAYGGYASDAEVEDAIARMNIDPNGKMVALTFDDGPEREKTPAILATLRQYNARATFFLVGYNIDGNEAVIEQILGAGCEIGNHTAAHTNLREVSIEEARASVTEVNTKLKTLFDYDVKLLRPPYGSYKTDDDRIKEMAKELGMSIIMWRRSVHDSHSPTPSADAIYARALLEIDDEDGSPLNGAILLFHDKYSETVEALKRIVPALQAQGYQLVTVSELLQTDVGGMNPGGVYRYKG